MIQIQYVWEPSTSILESHNPPHLYLNPMAPSDTDQGETISTLHISVRHLKFTVIESSESPITEYDGNSELSLEYLRYMNQVGWPLDRVFLTLLSSAGSSFRQEESDENFEGKRRCCECPFNF